MPVTVEAEAVAPFSARGPSPMQTIEPDVSAVGESILLPLPGGTYKILHGTSFSAPLLAGAAAVLKQQRPGLTAAQYRSLLINTAAAVRGARPQETGAGLFDLAGAMRSPIAAATTSVNFGISYAGSLSVRRDLHIQNLTDQPQDLSLAVEPSQGDSAPMPDGTVLRLEPRATGRVTFRWNHPALKPGAYQGVLRVGGLRIPYWAAVPTDRPAFITVLRGGDTFPVEEAVSFVLHVTDESGVLTGGVRPSVVPVEGQGLVAGQTLQVTPLNGIEGNYFVMVLLAKQPGVNQFRIQSGSARALVSFAGVPD
jgi:hypothetical protein